MGSVCRQSRHGALQYQGMGLRSFSKNNGGLTWVEIVKVANVANFKIAFRLHAGSSGMVKPRYEESAISFRKINSTYRTLQPLCEGKEE